ncbi:putative quinol monooxygenase [Flavobacterium sp.]|uniref:putative quinol monooxygenase n=1 Tax=Flavobacterium sp. TaxID=239 RepID=UPI0037BF9BA2
MFVRIVKMSFHEENIPAFMENFELMKTHIRNAPGNRFLELYQDKKNPCILFTYSYWETESDLENYRNSALFDEVWTFTKKLFNDKPEAWSVDKLVTLE